MSLAIDEGTPFGARAARRLREERVAWLTTVTPAGTPLPAPVWFWWDEDAGEVRVFSREGTPRTRNIAANPHVALHFDGNGQGGDIVVLTGRASIDPSAGPASRVAPYVEKYGWGFERLGVSPEAFSERYPVPVRIALNRLRGH
jgi:PPOX class probable F420-dependent enzyme